MVWLGVNLVTAIMAGLVVQRFEGTIEKVAALAALMPIVAGMGGNAGTQTVTLIIRSIALGTRCNGAMRAGSCFARWAWPRSMAW